MNRAKRKRDHERMVNRAWDGGLEGRAIRLETGRMNQTIARLKKQLAREQRKWKLLKMAVEEKKRDMGILLDSLPEYDCAPKELAEQELWDFEYVLRDMQKIEESSSENLNLIERNFIRYRRVQRKDKDSKDEKVSDVR